MKFLTIFLLGATIIFSQTSGCIGPGTLKVSSGSTVGVYQCAPCPTGSVGATICTFSPGGPPPPPHAPIITNVRASVTTTTALVTWTTDLPGSSQLISLDPNDNSTAFRRYPEPYDPTLVTSHSVTIPNLVPGKAYSLYEVSIGSTGLIGDTRSTGQYTNFSTTLADATLPTVIRVDTLGPTHVYAGSDLYFTYNPVATAGKIISPWTVPAFQVSGLDPSISVHVMCAPNPDLANEAADSWNGQCYDLNAATIRLRTTVSTPLGGYTGAFIYKDGAGVLANYKYTFSVVAAPAPITRTPPTSYPPIPALAKWSSTMTTLADYYCHVIDPAQGYYIAGEGQDWYYDGGRVFQQVADYTGNSAWLPCAEHVLQWYGPLVNSRQGHLPGSYLNFPWGLAMHFWRNGDTMSKQAVTYLGQQNMSGADPWYGTLVDPLRLRELAYGIDCMDAAAEVGQPTNHAMSVALSAAINQADELYTSPPHTFEQSFYGGLLAEALINHYSVVSPDPRIPPAIKALLDFTWQYSADPSNGALDYNTLYIPRYQFHSLNNLMIPAYAWYWALTGDATYLTRGDFLFQHALDDDISFSGKVFSQNYKWSFDYVRYRSGTFQSTIDPSSNKPPVNKP